MCTHQETGKDFQAWKVKYCSNGMLEGPFVCILFVAVSYMPWKCFVDVVSQEFAQPQWTVPVVLCTILYAFVLLFPGISRARIFFRSFGGSCADVPPLWADRSVPIISPARSLCCMLCKSP